LDVENLVIHFGEYVLPLIKIVNFDYSDFQANASIFPFSKPDDYMDDWRGKNNQGALFVIDEAHFSIPKGQTLAPVKKFYTMHGHYGVDILLLTQNPRQIDADILNLIEIQYRTIKNTALGSSSTYTKKVQDGWRGAVVNTEQRKYDSAIFPLYKAHTQSTGDVIERSASDIKPIWRHWSVYGAFVFLGLGIPFFIHTVFYNNPMKAPEPQKPLVTKTQNITFPHSVKPVPELLKPEPKPEKKSSESDTPFGKVTLHISGFIQSKDKTLYQFTAAQNGQSVFNLSHNDLVFAGYKIKPNGSCSAELIYNDQSFFVICDAPRIGTNISTNFAAN